MNFLNNKFYFGVTDFGGLNNVIEADSLGNFINSYSVGTGTWGDIIIAADLLEPIFTITQEVQVSALSMNAISFTNEPEEKINSN